MVPKLLWICTRVKVEVTDNKTTSVRVKSTGGKTYLSKKYKVSLKNTWNFSNELTYKRHKTAHALQWDRSNWQWLWWRQWIVMMINLCGAAVVRASAFTSEFVGSILATDSCGKSQSTLCRKSWVFSGFLPQGKLTGWVRINTVKNVISQLL
jgi:hypothetical protein